MSYVINTFKVEDDTRIEYAPNPKRNGSKAHARYEIYSQATTVREYLDLMQDDEVRKYAKADLRYDEEKGYLKIFDEDGNQLNVHEEAES